MTSLPRAGVCVYCYALSAVALPMLWLADGRRKLRMHVLNYFFLLSTPVTSNARSLKSWYTKCTFLGRLCAKFELCTLFRRSLERANDSFDSRCIRIVYKLRLPVFSASFSSPVQSGLSSTPENAVYRYFLGRKNKSARVTHRSFVRGL